MSNKKIIFTPNAPKPIGPYSQAIMHGNILFVSGQIAIDPLTGNLETSSVEKETKLVMSNIQSIIFAAGMKMENIVKTSIFLSDMNLFAKVNEIYGSYFKSDPPARETIQVARLPKDANVEISVIAIKA